MNKKTKHHSVGVAMVEFAIILPLLLVLLAGVTELGRALYQQNALYKAVASGARYLARTNETLDKETCEVLEGQESEWSTVVTTATNIITYGSATVGDTPLLPNLDDDAVAEIEITNVQDRELMKTDGTTVEVCVITVTAEVPFEGMFGEIAVPNLFGGSVATFNLRAETEERYIGR